MVSLTREERSAFCNGIAEHIKPMRKLLGLTQAELSAMCGVSRARILQVERRAMPLSYVQACGILLIFFLNEETIRYIYENELMPVRVLQYLQDLDEAVPPEMPVLIHQSLMELTPDEEAQLFGNEKARLTREETEAFCEKVRSILPQIRRVLRLSQAAISEAVGVSRARFVQLEGGQVRLTYGQMTAILFLCMVNRRSKEYLYAHRVFPMRYLQYLQRKKTCEPPTECCVIPDARFAIFAPDAD